MKHGKKHIDSAKLVDRTNLYDIGEALELCAKTATAKFDERRRKERDTRYLRVHADQQVRGAVVLPNGTGKSVRVLVIAKDEQAKAAEEAGAEFVGAEDMVQKIQSENWMDFDVVIATPNMMGLVGRLGRVLGPRGLMPNPKAVRLPWMWPVRLRRRKPVKLSTVWIVLTLSTAPSVKFPSARRNSPRTWRL